MEQWGDPAFLEVDREENDSGAEVVVQVFAKALVCPLEYVVAMEVARLKRLQVAKKAIFVSRDHW